MTMVSHPVSLSADAHVRTHTMPIEVDWDDTDHTTLLYTYHGRWNWDDVTAAAAMALALCADSTGPIAAIVDMRDAESLPNRVFAEGTPLTASVPQESVRVIVGGDPTLRAIKDILARLPGARLSSSKLDFADTLEEAREIVSEWQF